MNRQRHATDQLFAIQAIRQAGAVVTEHPLARLRDVEIRVPKFNRASPDVGLLFWVDGARR
jgi:hypothetical protein